MTRYPAGPVQVRRLVGRRKHPGRAGTALAAGFLALVVLGSGGGTAQAVAIRTSDGLALPTPGPQVSTAPSSAPAAGATPAVASRSPAVTDDWLIVALGLVAAAGFGGGLWLLLRRANRIDGVPGATA